MNTKKRTYTDPTGGGDDMVLTMPEWVEPPQFIEVYGTADTGSRYVFDLDEDATEDNDTD